MKVTIKQRTAKNVLMFALVMLVAASFIASVTFFSESAVAELTNITNVTVFAIVNVTNTEPNITSIIVDDGDDVPAGEIDLTANNVTTVQCNATIFDYNGASDINENRTSAIFYMQSVGAFAAADNNHLYRNDSCGRCTAIDATSAVCNCQFAVEYYANDSNTWVCSFNVTDLGGHQVPELEINLTDNETSQPVTVTGLLAIDAGPLIDYGNLSVTQTSAEVVHNITNVGNLDLNLSLRGFGGINESVGQNVTMICDFGNISIGNQRYTLGDASVGATTFATMTNLTNMTVVTNLTAIQRTDDSQITVTEDLESTIWRLQVPLGVGGLCNGTIIFGAIENIPN